MQKEGVRGDLQARYRHLCAIEAEPVLVEDSHRIFVVENTEPGFVDNLRSKVIQFEGINASGKKTQAWWLRDAIRVLGLEAEVVSFPFYDNPAGFIVWCYLNNGGMDHRGEKITDPKWWYEENRRQETPRIKEVLSRGGVIIYDRGADSNKAHQGVGKSEEELLQLFEAVDQEYKQGFPRPDLSFHLHIDPFVAAKLLRERAAEKGLDLDAHEAKIDHQIKAQEIYDQVVRRESERWTTVYCTEQQDLRPIDAIAKEVYLKTTNHFSHSKEY